MPENETATVDPSTDTPDTTPPVEDRQDPAAEAAKWKAMARKHEAQAKANADAAKRLAEIEDAQKTEAQRAAEALTAAERRAAEAELKALRLEVAADKGLTTAQARRLMGSTREELESDADDLLASFRPADEPEPPSAPRKPQERLRPGAVPEDEDTGEKDPYKRARAALQRGAY